MISYQNYEIIRCIVKDITYDIINVGWVYQVSIRILKIPVTASLRHISALEWNITQRFGPCTGRAFDTFPTS